MTLHGTAAVFALLAASSCALVVSFDDREHEPRRLSGTVTGLQSTQVSLRLGAARVNAGNGTFRFPAVLEYGSSYVLAIDVQPVEHHCSIRGGEGKVGGYDITGVEVRCHYEPLEMCDAGDAGCP